MSDPIMQMLGFGKVMNVPPGTEVDPEEEVRDVVPADAPVIYSRDIIKEALSDYIALNERHDEVVDNAADAIIKALAAKHLHIFKSKGSEL